jgi:hypothetical protein
MPGLRIHHATEHSCLLLVRHPGGPGRRSKNYHIKLDLDGNCIVSETVWKRLQEAGANFIVLNEIKDPPVQVMGFEDPIYKPATKTEIEGVIREITPAWVKPKLVEFNG